MLSEVVVGSVRNAPELAPAEREEVLAGCCCILVEAALLLVMVAETEILLLETQ